MSQFQFLIFVTILVFEFGHNFSFGVLSQFEILCVFVNIFFGNFFLCVSWQGGYHIRLCLFINIDKSHCVHKQGSSENDGRSDVYDRLEFRVVFTPSAVAPTAVILWIKVISHQFSVILQMMIPVYLYICVLVYVCTCICVYLYICVLVYLFTCVLVYLCICVLVY